MASVYDAVEALKIMGAELQALGIEAEKTTAKVRETNRAREGESTTGGMSSNTGGSGVGVSVSSSSGDALGDPRNSVDSAMRMNAAIQAAMRGR